MKLRSLPVRFKWCRSSN